MAITQTITTIPDSGHRGIDARDTFVEKQEAFQDALTDTFVTEINTFKTQANDLETNVNAKEATVVAKEALMNPHYVAIDAVGGNISSVNTVVLSIPDINIVAANIVDVQNAEENADIATQKALEASNSAQEAATSETNAASSASTAQDIIDNISVAPEWVSGGSYQQYQIVTDPLDFKTYKASVAISNSVTEPSTDVLWKDISSGGTANKVTTEFTATSGQTLFSVSYTVGLVDVYQNGMKLSSTDFTATTGTSITLVIGAASGDLVVIEAFGAFSVADTYTKAQVDAKDATKAALVHTHVEADITDLDKYTQAQVDAALNLKANSLNPTITGLKETSVAMVANDIDLSLGNHFTKTISGATTFTVSNVATTGTVNSFILELTNAGSATITWFSGVKWAGGTAPTLTTAGKDIISMYTRDGGTIWNVVSLQKDVK